MEQEPGKAAQEGSRLDDLKERLERGEYTVDPGAVADAILRRRREVALLRRSLDWAAVDALQPDGDHRECSYPLNPAVASVNTTLPVARASGLTRPIQVIRMGGVRLVSALSMALRADGGAQAHSS